MRILHFTHSRPDYLPPPQLSEFQIVAGPALTEHVASGRLRSIKTEPGAFDAEVVMRSIPVDQRPELVVVRADSSGLCRPRNLSVFGCPVVLIVGDTHHQSHPIAGLIHYAQSEDFRFIGLDYTRQHAHFFAEAGLPSVHWIPGFNQFTGCWDAGREPSTTKRLTFVGQAGQFHLRRRMLIDELLQQSVPIEPVQAPRDLAMRIHASSACSFNCSLNGDLNLRVLEVIAAGGALLTDRLSPEAGLELLFEDSQDIATYASVDECVARARELLDDPVGCRAMAARAHARWREQLHPDRVVERFFAILGGTQEPSFMDLHHEPRFRMATDPIRRLSWRDRCRAYESVQALHALNEEIAVLASGSVRPDLLLDLVDLPHAAITVLEDLEDRSRRARREEMLQSAGLADRVGRMRLGEAEVMEVLLLSRSDLQETWVRDLTARFPEARLVFDSPVTAVELAGFGFVESGDAVDTWRVRSEGPTMVHPAGASPPVQHFFQNLEGWFTFPALYLSLVKLLPEGARFVEVGSWKGKSLAFFLVEMQNRMRRFEVFAVDTWEGSPEHAGLDCIVDGSLFEEFRRNLSSLDGLFTAIRAPSLEAVETFRNQSLDAVFIDAGHEYEDVIADLHAWHPKLKPGGYLCGHDYSSAWPGVVRAVDEFFATRPNELISRGDEYCWVARRA